MNLFERPGNYIVKPAKVPQTYLPGYCTIAVVGL